MLYTSACGIIVQKRPNTMDYIGIDLMRDGFNKLPSQQSDKMWEYNVHRPLNSKDILLHRHNITATVSHDTLQTVEFKTV